MKDQKEFCVSLRNGETIAVSKLVLEMLVFEDLISERTHIVKSDVKDLDVLSRVDVLLQYDKFLNFEPISIDDFNKKYGTAFVAEFLPNWGLKEISVHLEDCNINYFSASLTENDVVVDIIEDYTADESARLDCYEIKTPTYSIFIAID